MQNICKLCSLCKSCLQYAKYAPGTLLRMPGLTSSLSVKWDCHRTRSRGRSLGSGLIMICHDLCCTVTSIGHRIMLFVSPSPGHRDVTVASGSSNLTWKLRRTPGPAGRPASGPRTLAPAGRPVTQAESRVGTVTVTATDRRPGSGRPAARGKPLRRPGVRPAGALRPHWTPRCQASLSRRHVAGGPARAPGAGPGAAGRSVTERGGCRQCRTRPGRHRQRLELEVQCLRRRGVTDAGAIVSGPRLARPEPACSEA